MSKETWVPDRGQIIWINFNPQSGREMRDMHPMLVLSPKNFNQVSGIVIGLPMTTADYNDTNPFAVKFQGRGKVISYVLTHQPKSFDWRKCMAKLHPWKKAPDEVLQAACKSLNKIVQLTSF
jgi:mRNA interferase MazF